MVKKQNNNAWIVYVIALIAIVALILAIVAMNKASVTGNAFWNRENVGPSPNWSIPSSPGIPLTDCEWEFAEETTNVSGTIWLGKICEGDKIAINGNCGSSDNYWVEVKQNKGYYNSWSCAFEINPSYPHATVSTNVLCCSNT